MERKVQKNVEVWAQTCILQVGIMQGFWQDLQLVPQAYPHCCIEKSQSALVKEKVYHTSTLASEPDDAQLVSDSET